MNRLVIVALVLDTFADLERSIEGLGSANTQTRSPGFSSISWTVAHVGQTIDAWLVNRLAAQPCDDFLAKSEFGRGSSGEGVEWNSVLAALSRVLDKAHTYLRTVSQEELEKEMLYEGSLEHLKGKPVAKYYWLARVVAHTYYHIGEITTIRAADGSRVVDFPGTLTETNEVKINKK